MNRKAIDLTGRFNLENLNSEAIEKGIRFVYQGHLINIHSTLSLSFSLYKQFSDKY